MTDETISSTGLARETAIANIKNVLHQNRAIFFAFWLPNEAAWNSFYQFWNGSSESAVWSYDAYSGQTFDQQTGGGHAVVCVGYDDTDPNNRYWIMLNSWGTANGVRPNGLFRVSMDCNYDYWLNYQGSTFSALMWQTAAITFGSGGGGAATGCNDYETPVSASIGQSEYYYCDIDRTCTQLDIILRVNSGDLDLFTGYGYYPDRYSAYDCYSDAWGTDDEQCTYNWPWPGRYYIQVFAYETGTGCLSAWTTSSSTSETGKGTVIKKLEIPLHPVAGPQ
jgi:hypothetical protein